MPLPQDIRPLNPEVMDTLVQSSNSPWIEYSPGQAWLRVLWVGAETGAWAVVFRWKKGFVAPPHKHLSASHTFILSGRLQIRDGLLEAGDYVYEANGILHGATTALEDTDYLFICNGPILFFNEDRFTGYWGWEEISRMQEKALAEAAA